MKILLFFFLGVLFIGITSANAFSDERIPTWVKNTAGWWATDAISENEFVNAIEFLVNKNIISVSSTEQNRTNEFQSKNSVPEWVKNTAGWWATDAISENEFVNAIEFLVKNAIINVNEKNDQNDICININELSKKIDKKNVEKLCQKFYDLEYEDYQIFPKDGSNVIDNHGFRCNTTISDYRINPELCEFPKQKPSDEYRIFLIGGSTMFSSNNDNAYTASAFLQEKISTSIENKKIHVINAGISGAWSEQEVKLVKHKIIDFEPDLIVVYDGWNDMAENVTAKNWNENWSEICMLGNEKNFETVIFLQPFLGTGYKTFFDFEYELIRNEPTVDKLNQYESYRKELKKLNENCYGAYDLTNIFDKIPTQIFFDTVHVGSKGDKILADNIFKFISPLLDETQPKIKFEFITSITDMSKTVATLSESKYSLNHLNFENSRLSDLTLEQQNITNSIFYNSVLKNINFRNADLTGVVFTGADLDNVDFTGANLTDTVFFKTKLNNVIFSDANFEQTSFVMIDFTNSSFDLEKLQKTELIHSEIPNVNVETDVMDSQINKYKPIDTRETFEELHNADESVTNFIQVYGMEVQKKWLFEPIRFLPIDNTVLPYEFAPMTYKTFACNIQFTNLRDYEGCLNQDDLFFVELPFHDRINENIPEMNEIYIEIMNNDDETIVIFPTISLHAYSQQCIWDYYVPATEDCKIIQLDSEIDLSSMNDNIWLNPAFIENVSGHFLYNTNLASFQTLQLLNYEMLSDLEIEKNPNILENYDKIIVLHNKYVSKKIFDTITNHPKVIYLNPGALSEEVSIDFTNNTITVLSPIKYPEEKNYRNDFFWAYDNTDKEFEDCYMIDDPKFEIVSNGIMTNCFSDNLLAKSKDFLKIIKDY